MALGARASQVVAGVLREQARTLAACVAIGIVAGLLVGKTIGVFGGSWLTARFTRAELNSDLAWRDVAAVSVLAGIGFTVALLIAQLAFASEADQVERAKAAVLIASVLAALIAAVLLARRNREYAD